MFVDPLTLFAVSVLGALVSDALRSRAKLSDHYPKSASRQLESTGWTFMEGENIRWLVEPGSAVWIESKYVRPIDGNIFSADKLGAIARGIRGNRHDKIPFYAGYGQVSRLTASDIAESIEYAEWTAGDPYTTGDPDLDQWVVAKSQRRDTSYDDEEAAELDERLAEAIEQNQGDLGAWAATVRDGNHRTFGAILGGESRVAVRLYDNDVQEIRDGLTRGDQRDRLRPDRIPLLLKAIQDTGALPEWFDRVSPEGRVLLEAERAWKSPPLRLR